MEVYSPKRPKTTSFRKNEIRQHQKQETRQATYFYDIKPQLSRRERFLEWINRSVYERMKEFFESDVDN
jgi:hypothetical protein